MGRKIPGKKHRTVKDPDTQRAKRVGLLQGKINNPPEKEDFQEMPKSVVRIMELKAKAKGMKPHKRKGKGKKEFNMATALGNELKMPGMDRPDRYIPVVERMKNESERRYIGRVKRACDDVVNEVKFEEKYNVEVKRDNIGNITDVAKVKAVKRSKKLKLCLKRKERIQKKKEASEIPREFLSAEKIEFGDIVHRPPTISTRPKMMKNKPTTKPGEKDLLLKRTKQDIASLAVSKKKKQPLSMLEKHKQEERRKLVVEAFRKLKKLNK